MLNKEIISVNLPALQLKDSVAHALSMMEEYHLSQLPVVEQDKYLGLALEDDLLNIDQDTPLAEIQSRFPKLAVHAHTHCLEAIQMANEFRLSLVPVMEKEGEFLGAISVGDLLQVLGRITGVQEPGAVIVLELEQREFSFSEICKLVETNDAQIHQLNTWWDARTETMLVTIKISKFEISDIIATFQRYEYRIKYYFGEELYENELKSNFDHLMNYLSI